MGTTEDEKIEMESYIKMVTNKFRDDAFGVVNKKVNGVDVKVATKNKFEWKWIATRLYIFAVVRAVDRITKDEIEDHSIYSLDYAIKHKEGLPRGLQTGVASFALLASYNIDEDAKKWVQSDPKKHFAAFEIPVIADLKNNKLYHYKKTPVWGGIYYKFFQEFIKKYF
jgi:hypothetical protein